MTVKFLSQEWLDLNKELAAGLTEQPGASAMMMYRITDGPDGEVVFCTDVADGRIVGNTLGENPDAPVTMTVAYDDFEKMTRGQLDATAALMQGKVTVDGDLGKVMALMPLTTSAEYQAVQQQVLDQTEF